MKAATKNKKRALTITDSQRGGKYADLFEILDQYLDEYQTQTNAIAILVREAHAARLLRAGDSTKKGKRNAREQRGGNGSQGRAGSKRKAKH